MLYGWEVEGGALEVQVAGAGVGVENLEVLLFSGRRVTRFSWDQVYLEGDVGRCSRTRSNLDMTVVSGPECSQRLRRLRNSVLESVLSVL